LNQLVVTLIFILIPGIVAAIISDKLTHHSRWDSFKFSLYSLTLGVGCYVLLQVITYLFDILSGFSIESISWTNLQIWNSALNGADIAAWEICVATLLSLPVAFFASWLIHFKFFNKIAHKLRVSNKFGEENLYSYYLNAQEIDWVYVRDIENNLTYQGRVVSHSENDNAQEIVLSEVSVFRYEDSEFLYNVPTIYLSRGVGKLVIEATPNEFLKESSNE
jgi:hypothetical protein